MARNRKARFPLRWSSYTQKRREIRLNQGCDRFVVYSEYSKQELVRNGFPSDKIDIHVPIRCSRANRLSSFSERNVILFAGQIIRGKGVDVLLRALAKVRVHFECLILGDGNHRPFCERLSAWLGLSDRVRFLGYVDSHDLERFYLEASVFAFSSVWPEPFGMAGPEAMLYGLPVVAFDVGGIRSWLTDGESGCLVPWMDTTAYAERLETLLRNKALARQLGSFARERILRDFNASRHIDKLERMFRDLIASSRSPAPIKRFNTDLGQFPVRPADRVLCQATPM